MESITETSEHSTIGQTINAARRFAAREQQPYFVYPARRNAVLAMLARDVQ